MTTTSSVPESLFPRQTALPTTSSSFDLESNAEFVSGLDDVHKFLEEVDLPDELDVGAGGTSIQEVLESDRTLAAPIRPCR